nr:hypothetical protein [Tanacetum cinerariifolium]
MMREIMDLAELVLRLKTIYVVNLEKSRAMLSNTSLCSAMLPHKPWTSSSNLANLYGILLPWVAAGGVKVPVRVDELKKHTWELPKEFLALPGQIYSVQSHIKTLEALPGLLNKVTGKSTASPTEGEKNTNLIKDDETSNLVDLMGINVVEE